MNGRNGDKLLFPDAFVHVIQTERLEFVAVAAPTFTKIPALE